MALAKLFGGSNHAAIRRYVEQSNNKCGLLVLKDVTNPGEQVGCSLRDYFQSKKFTAEFGNLTWPEVFGSKWPFALDYYLRKRLKCENGITLTTANGKVGFVYDFFNSTYNAFVLIYPKGEKTSGRTKIVIGNANNIF